MEPRKPLESPGAAVSAISDALNWRMIVLPLIIPANCARQQMDVKSFG